MIKIYTAKQVAKILGKAYITLRNRLKAYADGKEGVDFGDFLPEKLHGVWVFSKKTEPVEPATDDDVEAEKARLRNKGSEAR